MRLIDADALKDHYSWWKDGTREMTVGEAKDIFDEIVDLQPTAHGHWVKGRGMMYCSECGNTWDFIYIHDFKYCPSCGTRMEEDDEAEYEEPEINPCRGCEDYDSKGGCLSNGGCGERRDDEAD